MDHEDSSSELRVSQETVQVKNTFIHFTPPWAAGEVQRSASVPPSLRLWSFEVLPTVKSIAGTCLSDVSTVDDGCSEVGSTASSLRCNIGSHSPNVDVAGTRAIGTRTQARSLAVSAQPAHEPSLNSALQSRMRRPCRVYQAFDEPRSVAELLPRHIAAVVATAANAVENYNFVHCVKSTEGPHGWSVVAEIEAGVDAGRLELALSAGKQALLDATRGADHVHVLGYRAEPFVCTPVGFAACLGGVTDASRTCWTLINQGFCKRGSHCRWEHPHCQVNVNVMLSVRKSSE